MNGLIWLMMVLVGLAVLLWPRFGLIARYTHFCNLARKERLENALKHVHHCEYTSLSATLESLAGSVRISRPQATELAGKLEAAGLVTTFRGQLELTDSGRREALRVIRIHRLWERYFADYSGLDETLWHDHADRREHTTSKEETERMAGRLGYPRFDPHGAPIPTPEGDLPASRGEPLLNLEPGQWGQIVHLEDEPKTTYEQLVAQGLTIGVTVGVLQRTAETVRLEIAGEEKALAPVVAGNISVDRVDAPDVALAASARLSQLVPGEKGRVIGLMPTCHGIQRRRLLDLGLVPGTVVEAELCGSSGDPTAYRIRSALIALRQDQSRLVQVEKLQEN